MRTKTKYILVLIVFLFLHMYATYAESIRDTKIIKNQTVIINNQDSIKESLFFVEKEIREGINVTIEYVD